MKKVLFYAFFMGICSINSVSFALDQDTLEQDSSKLDADSLKQDSSSTDTQPETEKLTQSKETYKHCKCSASCKNCKEACRRGEETCMCCEEAC